MTIPDEAQAIIAQAISRNSVMASLFLKKDQLSLIVAAIADDLKAAGYSVVLDAPGRTEGGYEKTALPSEMECFAPATDSRCARTI